jgi:hypothetical protein
MAAANLEEYRNLKDTALAVEKLLADSPHAVNRVFANVLANIQKRIEVLEQEIKADEIKVRNEQAVAVAAAEKEAALNAGERGIFADLMQREYFTKKDMPHVNTIYEAWDRLTDGGKDAMSHRLWEGIRHGEQKFSELVDKIKDTEIARIYRRLTDSAPDKRLPEIPEQDRNDFIRAVEDGKNDDASRILDRQSFTNAVSVNKQREIQDADVFTSHDTKSIKANVVVADDTIDKNSSVEKSEPPAIGEIDLDDINLKDLKLPDNSTQGLAANAIRSDVATKRSL